MIGAIVLCLFVIFISCLSQIWYGFVLSKLWLWFIVPFFHLPAISIPLAIGLILISRCIVNQSSEEESDSKENFWHAVLDASKTTFIKPTIVLIMGWLVMLFL